MRLAVFCLLPRSEDDDSESYTTRMSPRAATKNGRKIRQRHFFFLLSLLVSGSVFVWQNRRFQDRFLDVFNEFKAPTTKTRKDTTAPKNTRCFAPIKSKVRILGTEWCHIRVQKTRRAPPAGNSWQKRDSVKSNTITCLWLHNTVSTTYYETVAALLNCQLWVVKVSDLKIPSLEAFRPGS